MGETTAEIRGICRRGFEGVAETFRANFEAGVELGAGVAVLRGDEVLVDLIGGWTDADCRTPWRSDTLVNVYSTSKGVTALVLARLAEAGLLDFDARVTDYWPEFGAAGKADVRVCELLSHQAGLVGLDDPVTVAALCEHDGVASRLAAAEPLWPPGSAAGYHPILWGTLAQELCRRASGSTVGALLAPWARALEADVHLGLADAEHGRCAQIIGPNRPWRSRAGITDAPPPERRVSRFERAAFANPVLRPFKDVCSAEFRRAEAPAANAHATAMGLARLYQSALAAGGRGLEVALREVVSGAREDLVLIGRHIRRSAAGFMLNRDHWYGPNAEAFGHDGAGGSYAFADPIAGISVAYVMNQMQVNSEVDLRGKDLLGAIYAAM
ncbi:MAG: serine hydrolase domain-containing protein [Pseudomonadota bacterium]|nr:serine hydrolase domain-containing protein [Pseudomonadota bacterium]